MRLSLGKAKTQDRYMKLLHLYLHGVCQHSLRCLPGYGYGICLNICFQGHYQGLAECVLYIEQLCMVIGQLLTLVVCCFLHKIIYGLTFMPTLLNVQQLFNQAPVLNKLRVLTSFYFLHLKGHVFSF